MAFVIIPYHYEYEYVFITFRFIEILRIFLRYFYPFRVYDSSTFFITYNSYVLFSSFTIQDPYVKVWLMFGDKRVEKKKTPVYKCNLNPIFNTYFEFDVPWEQIRDCALDVTVMDFDTVGRNELIGKLILGCK